MVPAAFRGMNNLNLDSKGRLAMPARYREEIMTCCEGRMIMTADFDSCLLLYPIDEWLVIEKKIAALSSLDKKSRLLKRLTIGYATDVSIDKNGRMLVPPPLRTFANLEKEIILIGQVNKFEIWNATAWVGATEVNEASSINKDDLIGALGSLSF